MKSNCLEIVNSMRQSDQDRVLSLLEKYQSEGMPAENAQRRAANEALAAIISEREEFVRRYGEPVMKIDRREANFKKWSGGAPLVKLGDAHEFKSGEPVVVEALHGTTNGSITKFDNSKSNVESDWGAGFYASNTPDDVARNYANNEGPDLTSRIEREAERIENELEDSGEEFDDVHEEAKRRAREKFSEGAPTTMKVFVRFKNPVVVGGRNETRLDYSEPYNEELDEYEEPTGKLVELAEAVREIAPDYNVPSREIERAIGKLWQTTDGDDSVKVSAARDALLEKLVDAYSDDGDSASHEIIRKALEQIGFDGIIDQTVHSKFKMKGMSHDTVHFIAFAPNQLKSATGNRGAYSLSDDDIRNSNRAQTETPEFKKWFGDSKVVDADGKPLVVYHGSSEKGIAVFDSEDGRFYFTDSKAVANGYGRKIGKRKNEQTYSVYLKMERPDVYDMKGASWYDDGVGSEIYGYIQDAKDSGFDGVILEDFIDGATEKSAVPSTVYVVFNPSQIKSATGNNGKFNPEDPDIRHSNRTSDIPDVVIGNMLGQASEHQDYAKAKAGDIGAAVAVAKSLVTQDLVDKVRGMAGESNPVIVPVLSVEDGGHNKIPLAAAEILAKELGLEVSHEIVQANTPKRTSMDGLDRIFSQPEFDGRVESGRSYILLDDTLTQGATFASLAGHINAGGGNVLGSVALTGKQYSAKIAPHKKTLNALREKHGDLEEQFRRKTGYGFGALTESEARYLANYKPAIAVRDRITSTGVEEGLGGDSGGSVPVDPRLSIRDGTSAWDMYESSLFDDIVYKLQNKMIDAKRVVEAISKYVGAVKEDHNVYLQEELFHGRAAKQTTEFVQRELNPLMEEMRTYGYQLQDLEEYLHARHAKEANAIIAQRNPDSPELQDGGSGMTNAAADAYMANLSQMDKQRLASLAEKVDEIQSKTRQMYVDYGLESQKTVDGWKDMFQHYVPLHREDKEGRPGIGQGFSVKGKETRGRTGSTRKVVDILANIAMQRERLIVRGEKNRVSNALVGLAVDNPNPDFWAVGQPPSERVYDPDTNTVVERLDPMYKNRENVVVAKVKGPDGEVKEVAVVFNEDNARALRMAQALKNLDAGNLAGLLGVSAKITRYFSAVNTQYNPVFGVVNLMRDVQHAMISIDNTPLAKKKGLIARGTISALRGIYQDMRAERKGIAPTSQWSKLWEEFQEEGGQTGYRQMFATSADRAEEMKKVLNPDAWLEGKYSKYFTANGTLKVPLSEAKKGADFIFNWLSDYNESMENGVRLSAYKVALDQGMSKAEAASLAKNMTVNFNRKGQIGQQAGAVYAFFNAAMQGTASIGRAIFTMEGGNVKTLRLNATGKKVVYGGLMLGAMQAMALASSGFSDDDPPEFMRQRSLIIPTGNKTYVSIPMPQGFNVLPNLGRMLTQFALSGFNKPQKMTMDVIGMFADNFNPIGNAGLSMQTLAPTALDPLVALTENKDFTGKPIARTNSNKAVPGFTQFKDSATTIGKLTAEAINALTGGNAYVAGALSPTPDQIDYLIGQATGGVGRELSKVEQTVLTQYHGEDTPLYKIPLVGRFYGDAQSQGSQSGQFYANAEHFNEIETEYKAMLKDHKSNEAVAFLRSQPDAYLVAQADVAKRQIQRLNQQKRDLVAKDAPREKVQAVDTQITAVMSRLNQAAERARQRQ